MCFLYRWIRFSIEFSSYSNVTEMFCYWTPKLIWLTIGWLWSFLLQYALFHQFHTHKEWNLQELITCLYLRTKISFIVTLRDFLVCSLKMVLLISHSFYDNNWWDEPIYCNRNSYVWALSRAFYMRSLQRKCNNFTCIDR